MPIPYRLVRSDRRTVSIQITAEGCVIVRAPRRARVSELDAAVESKRAWIEGKLSELQARRRAAPSELPDVLDGAAIAALTAEAKATLPPLVEFWAERMGVEVARVTVRHQSTRWGSCSSKGSISLNCLLMLCPAEVREYVIIHELCHRRHMDHSAAFWAEVRRFCPTCDASRAYLKGPGGEIIRRMKHHA